MRSSQVIVVLVVGLLVAACSGSDGPTVFNDVTVPADFSATLVAEGLRGPTQMVLAANGDIIVAELNGGENDGTGRILRLAQDDTAQRVVLQRGLDKPTGIAVAGDRLWIMERQRLSVTTLEPGDAREVVADELPFNGRSEGTLTLVDDGTLLYNTSGSKRGPDRVNGSGMIFAVTDAAGEFGEPEMIAEGFKHAYAHLVDENDQLWSVEMTDGTFDGERAADELLAVAIGADAGWPQCVDDNRAVIEFDGSEELCSDSPRSHALFEPGATPTSFVVTPWDADTFLVALWLRGEVVTVPRSAPEGAPHEPVTFMTGFEFPQHLLVDGERVLVSDHATGRIIAISANS